MSITQKDLDKVKGALKKGDFKRVAERVGTSQPWVSKVLSDLGLAQNNPEIISAALDLIEDEKQKSLALKQRIQEVTR